jgi:hypothetical protein
MPNTLGQAIHGGITPEGTIPPVTQSERLKSPPRAALRDLQQGLHGAYSPVARPILLDTHNK